MQARDVRGDYLRAYLDEHNGYRRTGRTEAAEQVAEILRTQFGHEVADEQSAAEPAEEAATPERADAEPLPENTAEPKPKRRGRPRLPREE